MQQNSMPRDHQVEIAQIIDETHDTKTFRVAMPEKIDFKPGQFFMVRFPGDEKLKRAYSIASSPTREGHLDISMNLVGMFTKELWETKAGDSLIFTGPYGKFFFDESMTQDLYLIAGGLGISPMRSIWQYCTDKKLGNRIKILYSIKNSRDIVYRKELESLDVETYIPTVTREDSDWEGRKGRIDKELLETEISDVKNGIFFLCGSLAFVKGIIAHLEELGIAKERIKTDIWGE